MNSRTRRLLLAGLALAVSFAARSHPTADITANNPDSRVRLLGLLERPILSTGEALVSGQSVGLRVLLPPNLAATDARAELFQIAGTIARPLDTPIDLQPDPADPRVILARFTPPAVTRVSRLTLGFGAHGTIPFALFPDSATRTDQASLAEALRLSHLRLAVCGVSPELRVFLRDHALEFQDLGPGAPEAVAADTLLLGTLAETDWLRLAAPTATGRVLAFIDDPALVPGVYAQARSARGTFATKITLPLPPLLPTDPRARETLFTLLFAALPPATR